jgi:hypothetical protein
MRILHLILLVFLVAIVLTVAREATGRVALVVFFTGLAVFIFALMAIMTLFRTVGAIGHANKPIAYLEAILATLLVLLVATLTLDVLFWVGMWLAQRAVD